MAFNVNIKFSSAGSTGQSYEISASSSENGTYGIISTVSRATLLAGTYVSVPDGSTWLKAVNVTVGCNSETVKKQIGSLPAPPTPAPPTPAPPTPAPPTPAPPTPEPPTPAPPTPAPPTPEPPTPAPPTPEPPTPAPPTPAPPTPAPPTPAPPTPAPPTPAPPTPAPIPLGSLLSLDGGIGYYTADILNSGQDYFSGGGFCYISQGAYYDPNDIVGKTQIFGTACESSGGQCTTCTGISGPTPAPPTPAPPTPSPALYGYFRSQGLSSVNDFCTNGVGYITSGEWFSTSANFFTASTTSRVYADSSYTPFNGLSLWYAVTTDPSFNTLTGGLFRAAQIDSDGYIISTSSTSCEGGGGQGPAAIE
jgi:hypothetical protein